MPFLSRINDLVVLSVEIKSPWNRLRWELTPNFIAMQIGSSERGY
jgi:hypothetical protein